MRGSGVNSRFCILILYLASAPGSSAALSGIEQRNSGRQTKSVADFMINPPVIALENRLSVSTGPPNRGRELESPTRTVDLRVVGLARLMPGSALRSYHV